ncbi:MAG TPA: hypothetical protein VLC74_07175 [Rhizomicrobium sp.]|nr:hypothetical protein [Rhizomicrobium sp.]
MKIDARSRGTVAAALFAAAILPAANAADAAVVISKDPTRNMSCSGGICTPTAADAVLNVSDLFFMLEDSDVTIKSTELAPDIELAAVFGWNLERGLTLDAYRSIGIKKQLTIAGLHGSLTLVTNDGGAGGDFWFDRTGHIDFWNRSAGLTINGTSYKLVDNIADLAAAIARKPRGAYALANDYNARNDGSYSHPPVNTDFPGTFEGLGHTILNLSIWETDKFTPLAGLFVAVNRHGLVRDLRLTDANVMSDINEEQLAGTITGENDGTILQCSASGSVSSAYQLVGGGLAGVSDGPIIRSFADVTVEGADGSELGGLAGSVARHVSDSYALGHVAGGDQSWVGGLFGYSGGRLTNVYSTGSVSGGQNSVVGGLIGASGSNGAISNAYWDITTSGTSNAVGNGNSTGITGLTTDQFKAGLPSGFAPGTWKEKSAVNAGYPYLSSNPPPKK